MSTPYLLATRKSALALWQAHTTQNLLRLHHITADIYPVVTTGDKLQHVALSEVMSTQNNLPHHLSTGKGLFIKEVQEALLSKQAHIAVHSMKDLPVEQTEGLVLAALLPRADARDVLILSPKVLQEIKSEKKLNEMTFEELKTVLLKSPTFLSQTIGTTSARRQLLVKKWFLPDLELKVLRGNVDSRLKRVKNNEFSAILLAKAGLDRLELFDDSTMFALPVAYFVPASAQGVIGIEVALGNQELLEVLAKINCVQTCLQTIVERMMLSFLEGDCNSATGVYYCNQKISVLYGKGAVEKEFTIDVSDEELAEVFLLIKKFNAIYSHCFIEIFNTALAKKCQKEAQQCLLKGKF